MKKATLILFISLFYLSQNYARSINDDLILEVIQKRHSGYNYDPDRIVTKEQIKCIIKAAQLTPSSFNDQPWRFIICDKNTNPEAYQKAFGSLVEFNQKWAQNAPVLIIAISATKFQKNNKPNLWAQYDTGAAAFSMELQATSLGLMAHQIGGFNSEKLKNAFSIPEDFIPMSILAIGYESHQNSNEEKKRKPLIDNFFEANWKSNLNF